MTARQILAARLHHQRLAHSTLARPEDVVAWLGAVQSQDVTGAVWAVAMRLAEADTAAVEAAFDRGAILRTHVLRPTWHFVAPADLRWLQRLTAPRVRRLMAPYDRRLDITPAVVRKSRSVVERALAGHCHLTRTAIAAVLRRAGIEASGQRLAHLVMHAELDAVICSGPRQGRQFTYGLVNERAPRGVEIDGDEALVELLRRYLRGHGPATLRDFAWWSGLTIGDGRRAADALGPAAHSDTLDGVTYWSVDADATAGVRGSMRRPLVRLLPNYDEYLVAHQDRGLTAPAARTPSRRGDIFSHVVAIDGRVGGMWRRTITRDALVIDCQPYWKWSREEWRGVEREGSRYARCLAVPLRLNRG